MSNRKCGKLSITEATTILGYICQAEREGKINAEEFAEMKDYILKRLCPSDLRRMESDLKRMI